MLEGAVLPSFDRFLYSFLILFPHNFVLSNSNQRSLLTFVCFDLMTLLLLSSSVRLVLASVNVLDESGPLQNVRSGCENSFVPNRLVSTCGH